MSNEVPQKYQPLFERVGSADNKSRADSIKAFCLRCVGYKYKRVRSCAANECPLHKFRPYQQDVA